MTDKNIQSLLIAKDVAAMLAIPVSTLRKNVSVNPSAVPPYLKLGKSSNSPVRWRLLDVQQWLQNQYEASNSGTDDNFTI